MVLILVFLKSKKNVQIKSKNSVNMFFYAKDVSHMKFFLCCLQRQYSRKIKEKSQDIIVFRLLICRNAPVFESLRVHKFLAKNKDVNAAIAILGPDPSQLLSKGENRFQKTPC